MASSVFRLRFRATRESARPEHRVGAGFRAPFIGETGRQVLQRIRTGRASLSDQIQRRAHVDRSGIVRPWREPEAHGRTIGPDDRVERIFWDAALGRSSAGTSQVEPLRVAVIVNDGEVRRQAAALGNKVVSTASYFPFVTGGFDERTTPERSVATKPSLSRRREYVARFAMWWYLGLTWGVWLTEAELRAGIITPPKNLGFNPQMLDAIAEIVLRGVVKDFPAILGGLLRSPGSVGATFGAGSTVPGGVERIGRGGA